MEGNDLRANKPARLSLVLGALAVTLIFGGVALMLLHDKSDAAEIEAYRRGGLAMALGLVIVGTVAWQEYRRAPQQFRHHSVALFANLSITPLPPSGSVLLALDPAYLKRLKQSQWLILGLPLLILALLVNMNLQDIQAQGEGTHSISRWQRLFDIALGVPLLVLLATAPRSMAAAKQAKRRRIGADGENLLYDAGDGIVQRHAWRTVMSDGRSALLLGKQVLQFSRNRTALFPVQTLKGYVLARVPVENRISVLQLQWLSIRRGNQTNRLLLVGLVLLLLVQLVAFCNPPFLQTLRTYLRH